jgi:hypothetical protein
LLERLKRSVNDSFQLQYVYPGQSFRQGLCRTPPPVYNQRIVEEESGDNSPCWKPYGDATNDDWSRLKVDGRFLLRERTHFLLGRTSFLPGREKNN